MPPERGGVKIARLLADDRTVRRAVVVTLIAVCAVSVVASSATASFPGRNGRIAWIVPSHILVGTQPGSVAALPPRVDAFRVSWSPDGRRLLISAGRVYVSGAGAAKLHPLATKRWVRDASWSPDGTQVIFSAQAGRELCHALFTYRLRDSREHRLTSGCRIAYNPSWSPNGRVIAYHGSDGTRARICLLTLASRTTRCIADGQSPAFSPDGTKLAYSTERALVVRDLHSGTERTLDVRGSDPQGRVDSPAWSPDGKQLVFLRSELVYKYEDHLYTVKVDGSDLRQFSFGTQDERPDWQPVVR